MTIKYTLESPIQFGSETISEIEFTQPKVKHLKKLDGIMGEITKTAKMIEICGNIPAPVVDEIDAKDLAQIAKVVEGFF
jgi:hypothetical protein